RRRHTRLQGDWSSDVCSSDLELSFAEQTDEERVDAVLVRAVEDLERSVTIVAREDEDLPVGDAAAEDLGTPVGGDLRLERREGEIGRASCRERVERAVGGVA